MRVCAFKHDVTFNLLTLLDLHAEAFLEHFVSQQLQEDAATTRQICWEFTSVIP